MSVSDVATAVELGEWGSAGSGCATTRIDPGRSLPSISGRSLAFMLPCPHAVPQSRRAQIRATRKGDM